MHVMQFMHNDAAEILVTNFDFDTSAATPALLVGTEQWEGSRRPWAAPIIPIKPRGVPAESSRRGQFFANFRRKRVFPASREAALLESGHV